MPSPRPLFANVDARATNQRPSLGRGLNADFMLKSLSGTDLMGPGRVNRQPEEHSSGHYEPGTNRPQDENCRRIVSRDHGEKMAAGFCSWGRSEIRLGELADTVTRARNVDSTIRCTGWGI